MTTLTETVIHKNSSKILKVNEGIKRIFHNI